MMRLKYSVLFLVVLTVVFISGCGYQVGSIMHPQVKTIAIDQVKNETIEPLASGYMRQALAEQFQLDNSLAVKGLHEADCILYGRIKKIKTTAIGYDSTNNEQTYVAAEFSLEVEFEFSVIIPGKAKPLINLTGVIGEASYQVTTDNDIARRRGIQQACRDAAEKAVITTVESW